MIKEDLRNAREVTLNGIDNSLFPLLFNLELKDPERNEFNSTSELVFLAEVLIKFSSLMVQIYWLKIISLNKLNNSEFNISPELNHILEQIWAGHLKNTFGYSNSILQNTASMPKTSILGKCVLNPNIFIKWLSLISLKNDYFKKFTHELNNETVLQDYVTLIKSLPFLKKIKYTNGKIVLNDFNNCTVDLFPFLKFFDYPNPLFLNEIKQNKNEVVLSFEEPYDSEIFEFPISQKQNSAENEKFIWIRNIKGFEEIKDVQESIVYLFDSGYRHISNISKAIITKTGDKYSIQKYLTSYKEKYAEIDPYKCPFDFLTLLIAELGPIRVLNELLVPNQDYLFDYLDYFENIGLQPKKYWLEQMQKYIETKEQRYKDLIGIDSETIKEIKNQIEREACIWCMLNAAGTNLKSDEGIIDPISRRKQVLQTYKKDKNENSNNLTETNKVFERTYKFLIIFYAAICKMYCIVKDQHDSSDFLDTDKLLNEITDELEDKYREICKMSLGILMKIFREEFINCGDSSYVSQAMKIFIGHNINDLLLENTSKKTFNKIDNISTNWIKHDIVIDKNRKEKISEFYDDSIRLFDFLQYGDFRPHESDEYTLTPIYPMVISFQEVHRNKEGMNIYHYEILSFEKSTNKSQNSNCSIKILTEQRYYQNENYYCIPNTRKSSKQWWVDPFLIQCSKFDNILSLLRDKYKA